MSKNKQSAIKGAAFYGVLQLLLRGISFCAVMYFSRAMTKMEYGIASNFQAWTQLLLPLVTLDLRDAVAKACYEYEDNIEDFLSSNFVVGHIAILILYVICEIFQDTFTRILSLDIYYIRILAVYLCFDFVYDLVRIKYGTFRNYKLDGIYMFIGQAGQIILSVILVCFMQDKAFGRILGITIPMAVVGAYLFLETKMKSRVIDIKYVKFGLSISLPLLFASLSNTILSASDRTMITSICGAEETAMYQIGYTVSALVSMIWMALNSAYGPWLYDNLDQGKFDYIKEMTRKYTVFYFLMVLIVMILSPEILYVLGGEKYVESVAVLPPIMLGLVFNFLYTFSFGIEYFYGETFIISIGTMLSALINVLLNLSLIPRFGYVAAAYTTLIGYIFLSVFHFIIVKCKVKKSYIFDNGFFVLSTVVLIIVQYLSVYLTEYIILRLIILFGVIALSCYFIYKNRNIVARALKR